MNALQFVIITLAVWRITHLLQAEDGPWDVVYNIRRRLGAHFLGKLMDCFFCLSVWIALPFAILFADSLLNGVILCFAFSGGAIFLYKISFKEDSSDHHSS